MLRVDVRKLPKSEVEIEAELLAEEFEKYFTPTLRRIGAGFEMDGFRPGHVPENILRSRIPESEILSKMAEAAISEHYSALLREHKIDAIGRPEITLTKLARGNPLGFKIRVAVLPDVDLPDYKKIAREIAGSNPASPAGRLEDSKRFDFEITDKEVEDAILDIRRSRAPKIHVTGATDPGSSSGGTLSATAESVPPETREDIQVEDKNLPMFDDDFVRSLGPFENVVDFREKLAENLKLEKMNQMRERTRIAIAERIIAESRIDLPEILIESELAQILYRMESDISAMGLNFEDYLKHIKKTRDDLRKEFRGEAEKKAKLSLVLDEIAKREDIRADPERVSQEVAKILAHYKEADPDRARMHAENVLINEAVFRFLESQ